MAAYGSREHRAAVLIALADACILLAERGVDSQVGLRAAEVTLSWAGGRDGYEAMRELGDAIRALDAAPDPTRLLERLADAADLVFNAHRVEVAP